MKVLLVSQRYHPFVGGVETHVRQVARELSNQHQVEVAAVNFGAAALPGRLGVLETSLLAPRYDSFQDGVVRVHSLAPGRLDRLRMLPVALRAAPLLGRLGYHRLEAFGYFWYAPVIRRKLRRLMRGIDVVHALCAGYLGWAVLDVARELGLPAVMTPFVHPRQWGDGPNDRAYYARADAVIGLVETDKQHLASIGVPERKLRVIGVSPELPTSADPEGFRRRHGLEREPMVLYVGRMMPQKGATSVLAAAAEVWSEIPRARFVFIGPANAQEARAFEGADSRVLYLGKVSQQEKADALSACDVFCMPSMSEILPTVYLEAWSYAKPVVGGRAHGLVELVEGNGAGLSAAQNGSEIAAALVRLLRDPELARTLGERGRQLVERRYCVQAVTAQLLELYQCVIDRRADARLSGNFEKTPAIVASRVPV